MENGNCTETSVIEKRVSMNIYRLRKQRGWTQSELAERLGVKQPFIARLESGTMNISIRKLQNVANIFGVDFVDLIKPVEGDTTSNSK